MKWYCSVSPHRSSFTYSKVQKEPWHNPSSTCPQHTFSWCTILMLNPDAQPWQNLSYSIPAAYLFMVHNLVQVGFEVFGQQDSLKAPGGYSAPVEVLHPEGPSELQLCPM